ncbi:hypothetical protein AB0I22_30930 [Streptomyces sp. NPDC050610]|uniref:hypothetical protein n=1 Tax=Streptomyces sp. NPDC050610 TaxID=3157097 RepID=UPI003414FFC3
MNGRDANNPETGGSEPPGERPAPGGVHIGGGMSEGVVSTGHDSRIDYRESRPPDAAAQLLDAVRQLRDALGSLSPDVSADRPYASPDLQLAEADAEIEQTGQLAEDRRRQRRDRVETAVALAAGCSSVAAIATALAQLLN